MTEEMRHRTRLHRLSTLVLLLGRVCKISWLFRISLAYVILALLKP